MDVTDDELRIAGVGDLYYPVRKMEMVTPRSYQLKLEQPLDMQAGLDVDQSAPTIVVPDYADPGTVLSFAKMTSNSYLPPNNTNWLDIDKWNLTIGFGWDKDGLRGYVFEDENDNLVLAYKGTSTALFGIGGGGTTKRDKYNDNMMFSCCCGKCGPTWRALCDCVAPVANTCNQTCLTSAAHYNDSYYELAQDIYLETKKLRPTSTLWLAGHSLGGALASLIGLTNSVPVFAFESPGELSFARRLGLLPPPPEPLPQDLPIYHFGNLGDPVFMGACNGALSICWLGGYALERGCHAGRTCMYDPDDVRIRKGMDQVQMANWINKVDDLNGGSPVVPMSMDGTLAQATPGNKSVPMNIRYHQINNVIKLFLEEAESVPTCVPEYNCTECSLWNFIE
ncbi:putative lipase atg15 [Thoreauomyces humboldtii]|nr:putative lipase atg15 [Thoreauomyces humboldtii]